MVLFFGPPGSGKSVQGKLLIERHGWQWLSTGHLFRESSNPEILKRMATGELIDDDLTSQILSKALLKIGKQTKIVLDGYPRNINQAKWLNNFLSEHDNKVDCIILLEVPEKELLKRLSDRGRSEDLEDVIKRRIAIYNQRTEPVVNFYRELKTPTFMIDGLGDVQTVHQRVQKAVEACSLA